MKRIFRSLAALLIIAISFSAISFAWLAGGKYLNFPSSFGGSAVSAYFAGGDGSEKNPFIIKNSVHLYNLAWLQYLGYFNQREGFNNGRDQTYFALGSNVDMKGRAIPPIGTEQYPFIGNFNGNGHTVKKLTVSNKRGTGDLVYAPTNANFSSTNDMLCHVNGDNSEVEIVGMFGVTGNYNGYLDDYVKTHTDLKTADVSVSNFYVDKIHVRSNSAKTLAGLAAGYIGGNFSNVGVYRGDLNFAANAQANGVAGSGILSKYSLVGAYNDKLVEWKDGAIGFGNSIGIKSLYERIESFYDVSTSSSVSITSGSQSLTYQYYSGDNKGSMYVRRTGYESTGYTYYLRGGIKNNNNGATYNANGNHPQKPMYLPIKTNDDYTVASDNTGYMAGGPFDSLSNGGGDIRVRSAGIASSVHIKYSTKDASSFHTEGKNVEILTITKNTYNTDDKLRRIQDDYNKDNNEETGVHTKIKTYPKTTQTELGLDAYSDARDEFNGFIAGESKWYGFHFMDARIGMNNIYTAPQATINGVTYDNYQMTANSIDFQTQSQGHIAFFAASNYSSNKNFFSLHEIFRNDDDPRKISNIREISKIYSANNSDDYIYLYSTASDGEAETSSGVSAADLETDNNYTLEFDCEWINNTYAFNNNSLLSNAIYYFEIPVNKGEFALGSASTGNGAYLLYLDIGANGNKTSTDEKYKMDKVRFVNTSETPKDSDGNATYPDFDAAWVTLNRGEYTDIAIAIFERDTEQTDGKYKLAYRVEYLAPSPNSDSIVYSKDGLQKSSDKTDD